MTTATPVFGPNTFVSTTVATNTSTSTSVSSSTSTSTSIGLSLLDNSPVPLLTLSGGQVFTADNPAGGCPNAACALTVAPSVTSALATFTSTATDTSTSPITFSVTAAPIRNYFKTVCLVTHIVDRYQPIYYENCITVSGEAFFVELASDGSSYLVHPASQHSLCMQAPGTLASGDQLDLDICNGSDVQSWVVDASSGSFTLVHPKSNSSLCMVRGQNTGGDSTIGLWSCDLNNTQVMWEPTL